MFCDGAKGRGLYNRLARGCYLRIHHVVPCAIPTVGQPAVVRSGSPAAHTDLMGASAIKCWQNDTKTLQCINLQPWSFKRAEFCHRTGSKSPVSGRPLLSGSEERSPHQVSGSTAGSLALEAGLNTSRSTRNRRFSLRSRGSSSTFLARQARPALRTIGSGSTDPVAKCRFAEVKLTGRLTHALALIKHHP